MTKNLKEFLQKLSKDENLAKEIKALQNEEDKNKVITKVIELAKSAGCTLTEADFEGPQGELDDEELKAVSGGLGLVFDITPDFCIMVGVSE